MTKRDGDRPPATGPEILPVASGEQIVRANGVDLCLETFGDPADPRSSSSTARSPRCSDGRTSSASVSRPALDSSFATTTATAADRSAMRRALRGTRSATWSRTRSACSTPSAWAAAIWSAGRWAGGSPCGGMTFVSGCAPDRLILSRSSRSFNSPIVASSRPLAAPRGAARCESWGCKRSIRRRGPRLQGEDGDSAKEVDDGAPLRKRSRHDLVGAVVGEVPGGMAQPAGGQEVTAELPVHG